MKKVVFASAAVLALTLTTGFTCSKKAPEQSAPEAAAPAAPAEQAQMAAPAASGDAAAAAPAAPAAPAPTENK